MKIRRGLLIILNILLLGLFAQATFGQIIFQDNFDRSPDWRSKQTVSKSAGGIDIAWPTPTYYKTCTTFCPPQGWTGYRASSSYYTDNPGRDTLILDSAGARGGSGKGITYNVEVTGAYGDWSAGSLYLYLGSVGYQELYVRYWLKYTSEWQWTTPQANQHSLQKLLRIARMSGNIDDPSVDPSSYYTPSWQGPVFIPDFYYNSAYPPAQLMVTEDYDPRTSGDISSNWSSFQWPGDNQWHCYEFRVKMNSAPGVADGEWEVWIDGASTPDKHAVKKNVPWVNSGKTTTQGWNWLMILDNVTNASAPLSSRKEMSIYMDDVVVSTNYSGPPPKPVSVSVQTVNSTTSRVSWAAGSNGATYLLNGYRIYYGTSPTSLTNSVVAGNVTSYDVTGLQPDQTYYFAITAFNKSSYDLTENESNKSNVVYPGSSASVVPGDLDGDGVVTSDDAQLALDMAVGKVAVTAGHIARGDIALIINGHSQPDGKIDTNDSIAILAKLAGKISF